MRRVLDYMIILAALLLMIMTGYCICKYPEAMAQKVEFIDYYKPVPGAFDGLTREEIEDMEREKAASQMIDRYVSGEPSRGEIRTLTMEATAYTWTGHRTTSGTWPEVGTVAVDPEVIPLGTRLYIEGYGESVAADAGGAIKGYKLDVYLPTQAECIEWGRRTAEVTILE